MEGNQNPAGSDDPRDLHARAAALLAKLYWSPASMTRVLESAGIDCININWNGSSLDIWFQALRNNTASLNALAGVVEKEYSRNQVVEYLHQLSSPYLGGDETRSPGTVPAVWNVPVRNAAFTGRAEMLTTLRRQLRDAPRGLHGLGGVGKTQLAIEYAHRFAEDYELVWWLKAEHPGLVVDQLAGLAVAVGVAGLETDTPTAITALLSHLGSRSGWLLVFDNVPDPADVVPWLPPGPGHVLMTSRYPAWDAVAVPLRVDVFTRDESVALIRAQAPDIGQAEAARLAQELGDLPLAVSQAASLMAQTGLPPGDYVEVLHQNAGTVLDEAAPIGYPGSLASVVRLSADRLKQADEAAAQLLRLCAFVAPEPVPLSLFTGAPVGVLPQPLATAATTPLALHRCGGRLCAYGLAQVSLDGPVLHQLTQAIIRDDLDPTERNTARDSVEAMLVAAQPDNTRDPAHWPQWAMLLPHLLATDPAHTANEAVREFACNATWYLLNRGDGRTALALAREFRESWLESYGPDDRFTLTVAGILADALRTVDQHEEAYALGEDILARRRRVLGDDDPATLTAASNFAVTLALLGQHEQARALDADTLGRRRLVLGEDHADTLMSASNLAVDLAELGQHEQARTLFEDVLARRRRILGEDHPETLVAADNLAECLAQMGQHEQARVLAETTLANLRRILGEDHPETLMAATNLANLLTKIDQQNGAN
jgi:tetratricopeptide (TPR) repeat protein